MLEVLRGDGLEHAGASGHGLGIEPKEYPLIDARGGVYRDECVAVDADIVLESGMVLNLECPPEYSAPLLGTHRNDVRHYRRRCTGAGGPGSRQNRLRSATLRTKSLDLMDARVVGVRGAACSMATAAIWACPLTPRLIVTQDSGYRLWDRLQL